MKSDTTWKLIGLLFVTALFYVGHGLHTNKGNNGMWFETSASAYETNAMDGVGVANENSETIFTCSQDGKTLYRWQYFSSKNPKFLGHSQAIETVEGNSKR